MKKKIKKIKKIFPQGGRIVKVMNLFTLEPNIYNKKRFAI